MAFRIRKQGTVTASFATAQEIVVDHANDSIRLGDGTNLIGTFPSDGGVRSMPVHIQGAEAGSLALDATLTGGTQKTKISDGVDAGVVEIDDVGGEKALKVSVIASVGGGGGGTAATDSAAFTATATQFTPIGGQMDDASSDDLAEGEMGAARSTAKRAIHVNPRLAAGGEIDFATQTTLALMKTALDSLLTSSQLIDDVVFVDDAAYTAATSKLLVMGGQYQAAPNALDDGDAGSILLDSSHRQVVAVTASSLPTGASTETTLASVLVDTTAIKTSVQLIDDTIFVDDAAFTAATSKLMVIGGQYQSAPNTLDDGDAGSILLDTNHAVQAVLRAGTAAFGKLAANSGVDIGDVDITSMICAAANAKIDVGLINAVVPLMGNGTTGTGSMRVTIASDNTANSNPWLVSGAAAHDAARAGNPVAVGGSARLTTLPALVSTAADTVDLTADGYGRQIVVGPHPVENIKYQTTNITNTTQTTIVTADASNCLDIIGLIITNNSTVDSICAIKDSTSGTTRLNFLIPKGGGVVFQPCMPLPQLAGKNNNWTVTMATTATSTDVTAIFGLRPT